MLGSSWRRHRAVPPPTHLIACEWWVVHAPVLQIVGAGVVIPAAEVAGSQVSSNRKEQRLQSGAAATLVPATKLTTPPAAG